MKAANAPRGIVVDAPFRITVPLARWMRETLQVIGFIRCAPHADDWSPGWLDLLSEEELREVTADGFGMTMYQIYRAGRQVTAEDGRACGDALIRHARSICLPDGCTLWFDAESFRAIADCLGVIETWARRVSYITDSRGTYNGSNFLLPDMTANLDAREQGEALWRLRGINRYWASMSQVYTPSVRGNCGHQIWEYVLHGSGPADWHVEPYRPNDPAHKGTRRFDLNATRRDSLGGRLRWAVR